MKNIGLIGGMSWESSRMYYEYVNARVRELLGGAHSARCIMVSVNFAEIERLTQADDWVAIGELMKEAALQLERAGADVILLCTNTVHVVSDYISKSVKVPFLHIASATGKWIRSLGLEKVALLGTRFTMEREFYSQMLSIDYGLEVLVPDARGRQVIHDIIYDELVQGQFTEIAKGKVMQVIDVLADRGAQGVILGCTELPILVSDEDVSIPTFDTGKIHSFAAVEWSLGN